MLWHYCPHNAAARLVSVACEWGLCLHEGKCHIELCCGRLLERAYISHLVKDIIPYHCANLKEIQGNLCQSLCFSVGRASVVLSPTSSSASLNLTLGAWYRTASILFTLLSHCVSLQDFSVTVRWFFQIVYLCGAAEKSVSVHCRNSWWHLWMSLLHQPFSVCAPHGTQSAWGFFSLSLTWKPLLLPFTLALLSYDCPLHSSKGIVSLSSLSRITFNKPRPIVLEATTNRRKLSPICSVLSIWQSWSWLISALGGLSQEYNPKLWYSTLTVWFQSPLHSTFSHWLRQLAHFGQYFQDVWNHRTACFAPSQCAASLEDLFWQAAPPLLKSFHCFACTVSLDPLNAKVSVSHRLDNGDRASQDIFWG